MAAIRPSSDVLVVGAGVVGLSIALALQERGAHVVVVERAGVAEGQSVIQPGGIRLQWGTTATAGSPSARTCARRCATCSRFSNTSGSTCS